MLKSQTAIMVRSSIDGVWVSAGHGQAAQITYAKAHDRTTLIVGGTTFNVTGSDEYLLFGKLGVCPSSVEFRFTQISFAPSRPVADTVWIVAAYAILFPGWVAGWSAYCLTRKGPLKT